MYPNETILEIMNFVKSTPEGNLLKMLKDAEMTDTHTRLLIKLTKNSKEDDFIKFFNEEVIPHIKLSSSEHQIKEKFWPVVKKKLSSMGLLDLAQAA